MSANPPIDQPAARDFPKVIDALSPAYRHSRFSFVALLHGGAHKSSPQSFRRSRGFLGTYESILCVNFERNASTFHADANLSIDALVKTAEAAYRKKSTTGVTNAVSFLTMYLFWYLVVKERGALAEPKALARVFCRMPRVIFRCVRA